MKITLKDIARHSNVSTATVSLVLNNKGHISTETRNRIQRAINELNYNRSRSRTSDTSKSPQEIIKFLRIEKHGQVINRDHDVFIADYLGGLTLASLDLDYKLEVNSFNHTSVEEIIQSTIHDPTIAGIIVLATELNAADMKQFQVSKIPIVFIDNYDEFLPFDFVDMDNKSSIHRAFQYIKSKGFNEIGFISSYTNTCNNFRMREKAYNESIALYPNMVPHIISVESTLSGAYTDITTYLSENKKPLYPVYICSNDVMALGAMKALMEYGYKIPEDISLIGFDNLPLTTYTDPPLSSIEVSKRQIARLAVQLLHRRIIEPDIPTVRLLVGGNLVIRESIKKDSV